MLNDGNLVMLALANCMTTQTFCHDIFVLCGQLPLQSRQEYIQEPVSDRTGAALFTLWYVRNTNQVIWWFRFLTLESWQRFSRCCCSQQSHDGKRNYTKLFFLDVVS